MRLRDPKKWSAWVRENRDEYGVRTLAFAKRWADAMELLFEEGAKLEEIAADAANAVQPPNVSGHQFGVAVIILVQCWVDGERLRLWFNRTYAPDDLTAERANRSGKILNPICIQASEEER